MILIFRRCIAFTLVTLFLFLVIGSSAVIFDGLHDSLHAADLAVVLGSKVQPDGQPSQALKARMDQTVDLRLAFAKFGLRSIYTSHARYWSIRDFYSVPRGVIGYVVYYFRDPNQVESPILPRS